MENYEFTKHDHHRLSCQSIRRTISRNGMYVTSRQLKCELKSLGVTHITSYRTRLADGRMFGPTSGFKGIRPRPKPLESSLEQPPVL